MRRPTKLPLAKLPLAAMGLACSALVLAPAAAQTAAPEKTADKNAPAKAPETAAPGTTKPMARPVGFPGVVDRNHHLGPGDSIDIAVDNFSDFSRTVKLFQDGTFDYPVIGVVQAAGLTTRELADKLTELFKAELRRPRVTVSIREIYVPPKIEIEIKKPKIVALGAVGNKGEIELSGPTPLRQVLARISPTDAADMSKIRVRYPNGSLRMADFSSFDTTAESKDDFMIVGGEEIILVERPAIQKADPIRFRILGEGVVKPGDVSAEGPISLLAALEKVGGPKPGAELEKIEVVRPGDKEPRIVNVDDYAFGNTSANYVCQEGDVITVRTKANKILLVGEVGRQGYMNIRESDTLMNVVLEAGGGNSGNGDISKTELIRRGPNNKVERMEINIRDIMKQKKQDVKLVKDDVIFVPHKKIKRGPLHYLTQIASPIWLLRSIGTVP